MDWRVFGATLSAIFVAELADKTQLVGMGMAAKTGKPFAVYAGSVCGYLVVTGISVLLGTVLARYLSPEFMRYVGGALFTGMGVLMLLGRI